MTDLTLTTYQSNGRQPLSIDQIDGNWTAIQNAFNNILGLIVPNFAVSDSADGTKIEVAINGSSGGEFTKPARPLNPRGIWFVGAEYAVQDEFTYRGSSYLVRKAHVAADIASDTAANNIEILAQAGSPGYTLRGPYDAQVTYAVGDGVTIAPDPTVYVLGQPAPAGTMPVLDGSADAYWSRGTISTLPSSLVVDKVYGRLDQTLLAIEQAITTINQSLVSMAASIKANSDAITSLTTTVKGNSDAITALTGRVSTLEQKVTTLQSSSSTGSSGTGGTGSTGTGSTGTTTAPTSAMQANAQAIRSLMNSLPSDLRIANSSAINGLPASSFSATLPNTYGQDLTTSSGMSSFLQVVVAWVQNVDPQLGQANNLAINGLAAGTFPITLNDLSSPDPSTVAGQKTLLSYLFSFFGSLNTDLGQANTAAINNLSAGTYPKSFPSLQAM